MKRAIARAAFQACKYAGLFSIARRVTRGRLRILCYHGLELEDEARFRPSLFLSPEIFRKRMRYLREHSYPVLPLDEAVDKLASGDLPANAVTITFDDGFYSTYALGSPILKEHGFRSTLYLTSYYFLKGTPIFQLAIAYMIWKSPLEEVDLSGLGHPALDSFGIASLESNLREDLADRIFALTCNTIDEPGRLDFARRLAERLEVDWDHICDRRILNLITASEARELEQSGMAIELHTHRHVMPETQPDALREIAENREAIEPVIGRPAAHFCFPSGIWSKAHLPILRKAGVVTATTCDSGLARRHSDPLALPRMLDDSRVSQIEFEAEVSGLTDLYRNFVGVTKQKTAALQGYSNWVAEAALPIIAA